MYLFFVLFLQKCVIRAGHAFYKELNNTLALSLRSAHLPSKEQSADIL